jgi:predicted DNA-binding transcriptional regulator AlpA
MNDNFLSSGAVRARFGGISLMTLHRWMRGNEGFPQPVQIAGRNFWRAEEITEWTATRPVRQASKVAA